MEVKIWKKYGRQTIIIAIISISVVLLAIIANKIVSIVDPAVKEVKAIELNINDTLPVQLSKIPLKYNNIGLSDESKITNQLKESFYKDEKVKFGLLSNDEKILAVLNNVDEQDIITTDLQSFGASRLKAFEGFSEEQIQSQYYDVPDEDNIAEDGMLYTAIKVYTHDVLEKTAKRIFGENADRITWKSIYSGGLGYDVEYIDGNYYWYHYKGGGLGNCTYGYSILEKAEQIEDTIYLYDKFIFTSNYDAMTNSDGNVASKYYLSSIMSDRNEVTNATHSDSFLNIADHSIEERCQDYLMNNKEKFRTYIHTFEKGEDDNYYWVSTNVAK